MLLRHNNKLMRFELINCTGRDYDNNIEAINAVVFVANMKTGYEVLSRFSEPVTELEAITFVEDYLSQPMTHEYYLQVTGYNFENSWKDIDEVYDCRGHLLEINHLMDTRLIEGILYLDID